MPGLLRIAGTLLIPALPVPAPLLKDDAVVPPVLPLRLRPKIADAPLCPLALDHREPLSVDTPPVALLAGSIREKLPVC
jgi:hypothetical protein